MGRKNARTIPSRSNGCFDAVYTRDRMVLLAIAVTVPVLLAASFIVV
jgi:hypothetical protein